MLLIRLNNVHCYTGLNADFWRMEFTVNKFSLLCARVTQAIPLRRREITEANLEHMVMVNTSIHELYEDSYRMNCTCKCTSGYI